MVVVLRYSVRYSTSMLVAKRVLAMLSIGVPETVKFVAGHTKLCDLLRIFNLGRALSHLGGKKAENRIF